MESQPAGSPVLPFRGNVQCMRSGPRVQDTSPDCRYIRKAKSKVYATNTVTWITAHDRGRFSSDARVSS
jgi:hypothetical protein